MKRACLYCHRLISVRHGRFVAHLNTHKHKCAGSGVMVTGTKKTCRGCGDTYFHHFSGSRCPRCVARRELTSLQILLTRGRSIGGGRRVTYPHLKSELSKLRRQAS